MITGNKTSNNHMSNSESTRLQDCTYAHDDDAEY